MPHTGKKQLLNLPFALLIINVIKMLFDKLRQAAILKSSKEKMCTYACVYAHAFLTLYVSSTVGE